MRIKIPFPYFTTILCSAALALSIGAARASESESDDDHEQGGHIEGVEDYHSEVRLLPTDAAPGAGGEAELEVENDNGTTQASLKLSPEGLVDGSYNVFVTKKSDGTTVYVGAFDLVAGGSEDEDENEDGDDDEITSVQPTRHSASKGDSQENDGEFDEVEFGGENGIALPDGLNALDIATVQIASGDTILLIGDFTNIEASRKSKIHVSVKATPGSGSPEARGHSTLNAFSKRGRLLSNFILNGRGLPADTMLNVNVNGETVRKVRTDRSGKVRLKKLPGVNLFSIHEIQLSDDNGAAHLGLHF